MPVHSDRANRIYGTTYPTDRAPPEAVPLGAAPRSLFQRALLRLAGVAIDMLAVGPGDVLVLRTDRAISGAAIGHLTRVVRAAGGSAAVVLPVDCQLHLEPARLATEDRGYRETRVTEADAT